MPLAAVRLLTATVLLTTVAGCGPEGPAAGPEAADANVASVDAEFALDDEAKSDAATPSGPTLGDVHFRWQERLAHSDERFARWVRADPEDPVDAAAEPPPLLPEPLPPGRRFHALLPPPDANRFTKADLADEYSRFWVAEVERWNAAHPLTEDEALLMNEVAGLPLRDDAVRRTTMTETAARIREAGTDDPLVRAHLLWEQTWREERSDAILPLWAETNATLFKSDAPPWFRFRAALWRLRIAEERGHADAEAALESAAEELETFAASLTPASETLEAFPHVPQKLLEVAWEVAGLYPDDPDGQPEERAVDHLSLPQAQVRILDALSRGAEAGGDPYAFHCYAGDLYVETAWDARGAGYVNEVRDGAWEVFQRRLTAAARHFHAAYLHRPDLAPAATGMITVSMGHGDSLPPAEWFRRAVAGQVDHWQAYMKIATALQPKWGSSWDALVSLAEETLREDLADTSVPVAGLEIVRQMADAVRDEPDALASPAWRVVLSRHTAHYAAEVADEPRGWTLNASYPPRLAALHRSLKAAGMEAERTELLRAWPEDDAGLRRYLDGYSRTWELGPLLALQTEEAPRAERLIAAFAPDAPLIAAADLPGLEEDVSVLRRLRFDKSDDRTANFLWTIELKTLLGWLKTYHAGEETTLYLSARLNGFRCGAESFVVEKGVATLSGSGESTPYLSPLIAFPGPTLVYATVHPESDEDTHTQDVGIGIGPGAWDANAGADGPVTGGAWFVASEPDQPYDQIGWLRLPYRDGGSPVGRLGGKLPYHPLQALVRPQDVAGCFNQRFAVRHRGEGPTELGPIRFGVTGRSAEPQRFTIQRIGVMHRPDFTLPQSFRDVPSELQEPTTPSA